MVDTNQTDADRPFVESGTDDGVTDDEVDILGGTDGAYEDALSPEEAAMRIVDEPAGLNYDADPGYLDPE